VLDEPLPVIDVPAGLRAAQVSAESAVALIAELRARERSLRLFEALSAMRVAEAIAGLAVGDRPARAWRAVRDTLGPFDDGTRRHPQPATIPLWAARLHRSLTADGVRVVADQLPSIAASLETAAHHWARHGALLVPASELPFREERVEQILRGRVTRADELDLVPTITAIRAASAMCVYPRITNPLASVQLAATAHTIAARPTAPQPARRTCQQSRLR
jgi:hypothetical protein